MTTYPNRFSLLQLQTCLLQDTPESSWRNIQALLTCDGHYPRLREVFELAVATHRPDQLPSVPFDQPNDVSYLHRTAHALSAEPRTPHRIRLSRPFLQQLLDRR